MRDNEELLELIEKHLTSGLNDLWDALTPEERMVVFRKMNLIVEYIGVTY